MQVRPNVLAALRAARTEPLPEPLPDSIFRCQNTSFGAYLIAAGRLRYRGAALAENRWDVDLLFDDPESTGPELQRRYNAGAVEPVNPHVLFQVRGFLLSDIKRLQSKAAGVNNAQR